MQINCRGHIEFISLFILNNKFYLIIQFAIIMMYEITKLLVINDASMFVVEAQFMVNFVLLKFIFFMVATIYYTANLIIKFYKLCDYKFGDLITIANKKKYGLHSIIVPVMRSRVHCLSEYKSHIILNFMLEVNYKFLQFQNLGSATHSTQRLLREL